MPFFPVPDDLDPRLTPAREDLAASWLKGKVAAARYIEPTRQQITTNVANLYYEPGNAQASLETQLLYGEPVDVFEEKDGWAWVQSVRDGYVGYMETKNFGMMKGDTTATHRVANIGTFVFPSTDPKASLAAEPGGFMAPGTGYKATPAMTLSYGSAVKIVKQGDVLSEISTGGFVPTAHLAPSEFYAEDPVAEAFRFLGVPYLWGGRSQTGVDCSALIQLVLQACNIKCPRDCNLQERMLGRPVARDEVRGGDLVFFKKDHIGLMIDDSTMIHASDRAMAVSIDDIDEYSQWRISTKNAPLKLFKRIG